jgi:hypothetical protein
MVSWTAKAAARKKTGVESNGPAAAVRSSLAADMMMTQ